MKRRVIITSGVLLGAISGGVVIKRQWERLNMATWEDIQPPHFEIPSREKQIEKMKTQTSPYDILIIGGGATGCGIALDAASRNLKVALVEKDDFSSGTSSRSTKLVHGGIRYLEKAFRNLDKEQYNMVREALHERKNFLKIAPHLSYELPIMIPLYKWWHLPYYWVGSKAYDLLAGKNALQSSYFISKPSALEIFPHLAADSLKGAIIYHDGAHNDSRMNVILALTAAKEGAHIANHVEVVELLKNSDGKVSGAVVRDYITGEEWKIQAKGVVNATGPFTDAIRKMDDKDAEDIVCPSSGVHVILPDYYSPKNMGLLDAATSDGRVIFFLPWEHSVIAGTTDTVTEVTNRPQAKEEEIQFILNEISSYLSPAIQVRRADVLSSWAGIRPLVRDPSKLSTEGLARNHLVITSKSGLVTVAGGKWTTYRAMAADTVDVAIKEFNLEPKGTCQTEEIKLIGAHAYNPSLKIRLIQEYGMESQIAEHLAKSYGDRAYTVADYAKPTGRHWPIVGRRISSAYPYIEAEIIYAVRDEMARRIVDVIARRTRLAFVNVLAAYEAIPRVGKIMQKELQWSDEKRLEEEEDAKAFLNTMGFQDCPKAGYMQVCRAVFRDLDTTGSGLIDLTQFKQALQSLTISCDENEVSEWFNRCSSTLLANGEPALNFIEFVELTGLISNNDAAAKFNQDIPLTNANVFVPERSGGGV